MSLLQVLSAEVGRCVCVNSFVCRCKCVGAYEPDGMGPAGSAVHITAARFVTRPKAGAAGSVIGLALNPTAWIFSN
jgi:hypothetical protein